MSTATTSPTDVVATHPLVLGGMSLAGRIMLAAIFLMSALGNKIPKFDAVAGYMASEGVPAAPVMLVGGIVFLLAGSLSLISGFKTRGGATLLLVFLILATFYFHDFWTVDDAAAAQKEMIQFMKNLALMGAMLLVIVHGAGPMSLDRWLARREAS